MTTTDRTPNALDDPIDTLEPVDGTRAPALLAQVGPNWWASVMGTGIVANAAAVLPVHAGALTVAATVVWLVATAALVFLSWCAALQVRRHPHHTRRHARDAAMLPFWGAPPMAILTVATGTHLYGPSFLGETAANATAVALWLIGTVIALIVPVAVTASMMTRTDLHAKLTLATWLMPVVPPMVAATTGAVVLDALPHRMQLTALVLDYAMFGVSLLASIITITLIWARLMYHDIGPARTVPTLWIVLGPLGQSIAAASLLGAHAHRLLPAPSGAVLDALALAYGMPIWGFAMFWIGVAATITIRAMRHDRSFSLTWWSFTFPVGTVVLGTAQLAHRTGSQALDVATLGLYGLLLAAWITAATRTLHGLRTLTLFEPGTLPPMLSSTQRGRDHETERMRDAAARP